MLLCAMLFVGEEAYQKALFLIPLPVISGRQLVEGYFVTHKIYIERRFI